MARRREIFADGRQIPSREFSRRRRTILLLRSGASADRRKLFRSFSDGGALPRRRYGWRVTGFGFADDRPANSVVRIHAFLFGRWAVH
jgi:hypothetical protein